MVGEESVPTAVGVSVTNLNTGCADTIPNGYSYIPADTSCRVEPPPPPHAADAGFSFFVVGGNTVQFTDSSSGPPTSWQWDFTNNGNFESSQQNPQFTLPGAGHLCHPPPGAERRRLGRGGPAGDRAVAGGTFRAPPRGGRLDGRPPRFVYSEL